MNSTRPNHRRHRHRVVTQHAVEQRSGIPYQVERRVCSACRRELGKQPVRRAAL